MMTDAVNPVFHWFTEYCTWHAGAAVATPDVMATAVPAASPVAATRLATFLTRLVAPGVRSLMTYTSMRDAHSRPRLRG